MPLQRLPGALAPMELHNSPLSEMACMGFEYGYSMEAPESLVLWEAQFGDFANGAQVIIDQFIISGLAKWGQTSRLTLLLPHGYEGAGPEHSSARLERFLQLAAEGNLRVAYPTTPAQYFHLLRRQGRIAKQRPLIVMTPKSLLRLPQATNRIEHLTDSRFHEVLAEPRVDDERITRLVLCTGKIYYDLVGYLEKEERPEVAIARVELLYPFPQRQILELVQSYPNLREVIWAQEEPRNMGARAHMSPRLMQVLPEDISFGYVGRPERASPGEGYPVAHVAEQNRILRAALDPAGARLDVPGQGAGRALAVLTTESRAHVGGHGRDVRLEAVEQLAPALRRGDRRGDLLGAGVEVAGLRGAEAGPEDELGGARRELGGPAEGGAGLVVAPLGEQRVALVGHGVGAVQDVEARELGDGIVVVLDAQLLVALPALARGGEHEQRRRLAAADVAAGDLGRLERGEQALGQRAIGAAPVGRGHRLGHARAAHHVGLAGEPAVERVTGVLDAAAAGVRGGAALGVDDADLAHRGLLVAGERAVERGLGARAGAQVLERGGADRGVGNGLRRAGADAGLAPGDEGPDGEPVGLDRDAEGARAVAGDDRVRAVAHPASLSSPPMDTDEILARIRATPEGFVRTYGDVSPGAPRRAGAVLAQATDPDLPWYRIVRADGSLTQGDRQRALLEAEGVPFRTRGRVDLDVCRYRADEISGTR